MLQVIQIKRLRWIKVVDHPSSLRGHLDVINFNSAVTPWVHSAKRKTWCMPGFIQKNVLAKSVMLP